MSTSFNEEFCTTLEYHLCKTFSKSDYEDLKGFWCDGISWIPVDEKQLEKEELSKNKQIITEAWIGKNGQDKYQMTIYFGKFALNKYLKDDDLLGCIPSSDSMDWIVIDPKKNVIEIYLM